MKNWRRHPTIYLVAPMAGLFAFFLGPLVVLAHTSVTDSSVGGTGEFTLGNYTEMFTSPVFRAVMENTLIVSTVSMAILLVAGFVVAYVVAFHAGKWEVPILVLIILSDQLNPLIRVYAWRLILGRNGLVNYVLQTVGLIDAPLDILLFSKVAVVIVLSAGWLPLAVIPMYAAFKTIDLGILDAAGDLGSRFGATLRTILLPLAAPGIVAAVALIYLPLMSDFATPALVGGVDGYMAANYVADQMLGLGNWGIGAAAGFALLALSGLVVGASYRIAGVGDGRL